MIKQLQRFSILLNSTAHLVYPDVGEDHDRQRPVEGDRAGEHQVADVLGEGAFPRRRGAWGGHTV